MSRPDSVDVIGFGKLENNNFHKIYFDFLADIRQLYFLINNIPDLVDTHFAKWASSLDEQISNFNKNEIEELERIKNFKMADPEQRKQIGEIKITETKVKDVTVEIIDYGFLKFNSNHTINKMILTHLIAEFETFIKNTLELVYHVNPKILKSKKTLEFEELVDVTDLHKITHLMIDKQLDDLLRQDIEKISDYFEEKIGLKFSDFETWDDCKERFYRRNIVTHNNGVPNTIYWSKVNLEPQEKMLIVDKEYLKKSFDFFQLFSHYITDYLEIKFGTKQHDPKKRTHITSASSTDNLYFEEKLSSKENSENVISNKS